MQTFFSNLKRWLARPAFLASLKERWPHLLSPRVLLLSGVAVAVAAGLVGLGVYAAMNGSDDSALTNITATPAPTVRATLTPTRSPTPSPTPVHEPQELVDPDAGPAPPPEAPSGDSVPPPSAPVGSGMRLVIDALGINAPVITLGLDANAIPEVPLTAYEVAWYNFSSPPGGPSNAVFSGHVTWRGQAVFYRLPELGPGSTVKVVMPDGTVYTYEVFKNVLVSETDISVMLPTSEPIITLITCGGTWVPDSSQRFGGDYTGRTVVQARLIGGG